MSASKSDAVSVETKLGSVTQKALEKQREDVARPDYREPHGNLQRYLDTLTVPELRAVVNELAEENKRANALVERILDTQQSIREITGA
ncbi:hypothetical protein SEA_MILANI_54 [Microbacterium phage Milani]|nr:hypothetical protein SEA_MILANI_54 [Microbacterium phage Milani]